MSHFEFVFAPLPRVAVEICDSDKLFPVHRIFCVGRNYSDHVREMGFYPAREDPFYFTKSPSAFTPSGSEIPYPTGTSNYHHEMELVVAIGKCGRDISEGSALEHVYGFACGLDMTRRDLQLAARDKGRPWDLGKDIENGAVISALRPISDASDIANWELKLTVNGELRQSTTLQHMIWSVPEIISHLSRFYTLVPGDLIMTGTPAGVGPVVPGDALVGEITGLSDVTAQIVDSV